MEVLLALGSNLSSPIHQVLKAFDCLESHPKLKLIKRASLYSSSPLGPQDQDDFVNSAALVSTELSPHELLQQTQALETSFGRMKTRHWGERIIDIDIIFYGQESLSLKEPDLFIPHREALLRDFVLIPCLELVPNWRLPSGEPLAKYSTACGQHNLKKIDLNLACS